MGETMVQPGEERLAIAGLVGAELGGRYQLERVLGAGGMGAVFEGRDLRLGRAVAVKVMLPGYARDAEYVKRFLREAQTASMIRHRNVVVILDFGEAESGLVYSVMERLRGQDLEEFLKGQPGQRVSWEQACGLLVQIANGLRAAHAEGVIHRDVKPANCFLTTEDDEVVVKVVDFGIAKLGEGMQTQQLTGTGNVLGTPSYTAPEMVLTGGPASPRSDVYSLGVVAYRMLAGRLPFTGKTAFEVMHHACILPVPGIREAGVEVPQAVEALVLEMLSKNPEERPADMGEVRQRLVALGRETGGVLAAVEGAGSSALRIEVEAGASGAGEVTRTEVLDSGNRAAEEPRSPSGRTLVTRVAGVTPAGRTAPAGEVERTAVMIGAGFREPSGPPLAAPVVAGEVERTAVLDSGKVERPQQKVAGWLVGGGVIVALVAGGVAWMMSGQRAPEVAARGDGGVEAAAMEPRPQVQARAQVDAESGAADAEQGEAEETKMVTSTPALVQKEDVGGGSSGSASEGAEETTGTAGDGVEAESAVEEPAVVEPPKPTSTRDKPKRPTGPPSDAALKKKLSRKIAAKCAAELVGKRVTVVFDVTTGGEVKRLTAMPKGAAEVCAKRQVAGTKFRTRDSESNIEIVVG